MDPVPPIVIQHPEILPVARALGSARVSRDGRGQDGRQGRNGGRRSPEEEPRGSDEPELEQLSAGAQTPHLLDVVADDDETDAKALQAPEGATST